jgi:hypothetical protein
VLRSRDWAAAWSVDWQGGWQSLPDRSMVRCLVGRVRIGTACGIVIVCALDLGTVGTKEHHQT